MGKKAVLYLMPLVVHLGTIENTLKLQIHGTSLFELVGCFS